MDPELQIGSYMPVHVYSGECCVRAHPEAFAAAGKRCLIVVSGSAAEKSGALADCIETLNGAGVRYAVFNGVGANPETRACRAAGTAAAENGCDFIVGIGGGSAMDAAKAAAIFAAAPDMPHNGLYTRVSPAPALPVLLIGTTAGTGSEVTGVSVLTNSDTGMKKSISGADCYARAAFCDARYTCSVPPGVTLSTALDALAHAVESRLCLNANDLSALYAVRAISLLGALIADPGAAAAPTPALRQAWYTASLYAGLAINITGTAFPHTLGYPLTELYGVPHGAACAAFMPALLLRAKEYRPDALGAVEEAMGIPAQTWIGRLGRALAFDFRFDRAEAETIAARWENGVKNFDRSPGGFTARDAADALVSLPFAQSV